MQSQQTDIKSYLDNLKSYFGNDQRTDYALENAKDAYDDMQKAFVAMKSSFNHLYTVSGMLLWRIGSMLPRIDLRAQESLLWLFRKDSPQLLITYSPDDKDEINWIPLLESDEKDNKLR